jgi:hypothetical protein
MRINAPMRSLLSNAGLPAEMIYVNGRNLSRMSKKELVKAVVALHAENVNIWAKLNGLMRRYKELITGRSEEREG